MNLLLGAISIVLCFGAVTVISKLFKKEGLMVWVAIASVIANILVCKTINILGFVSAMGNILFASNFLATDIIMEKYGPKEAKKTIFLGMLSTAIFMCITQISLLFIPDITDIAHGSMETLFALNLRTSIASVIMYFIGHILNITIYEAIRKRTPKKLWLRNNVATIISNSLENYLFAFFAFVGIFDIPTILSIATTGTIIEIIIAVLDTPFLYWAKGERE